MYLFELVVIAAIRKLENNIIISELIKTAEYRINADKFIKTQQEIYSKLIINKPNITISELTAAKNAYNNFEKSFINFESHETQTESLDVEYQV